MMLGPRCHGIKGVWREQGRTRGGGTRQADKGKKVTCRRMQGIQMHQRASHPHQFAFMYTNCSPFFTTPVTICIAETKRMLMQATSSITQRCTPSLPITSCAPLVTTAAAGVHSEVSQTYRGELDGGYAHREVFPTEEHWSFQAVHDMSHHSISITTFTWPSDWLCSLKQSCINYE